MFGLFTKSKPDISAAPDWARGAEVLNQRRLLYQAMMTVCVRIDPVADVNKLTTDAAVGLVKKIVNDAGCIPGRLTRSEAIGAGLLAVTFASHLSRTLGGQFEICASASVVALCRGMSETDLAETHSLIIELYNLLTVSGKVIPHIGQAYADWMCEPSVERYAAFLEGFRILVSANA